MSRTDNYAPVHATNYSTNPLAEGGGLLLGVTQFPEKYHHEYVLHPPAKPCAKRISRRRVCRLIRRSSGVYVKNAVYTTLAMLNLRTALIVALLMATVQATAAEIVARTRTWAGSVTLESEGDDWMESCSLRLIAQFQQSTHRIGLKRPLSNCSLFGPVQLVLSETPDHHESLVVVEAARGGDGDHTGPLLEVFRVDKSSIRKLGEIELFSATYLRKGQEIQFIEGRRLFSLCTVCDGPEAADPNDNIFVPVRVSIIRAGLAVLPTVSASERAAILARFQQRKIVAEQEYGNAEQIATLEKNLRVLLRIK